MAENHSLKRTSSARLPTDYGVFTVHTYLPELDNGDLNKVSQNNDASHFVNDAAHFVCVMGKPKTPPLVRIHSECLTGDVFLSTRCDCGQQLHSSLSLISEEGAGILIYLRQEGRGIGLAKKIEAYHLQDEEGHDTVDANLVQGFSEDGRTYEAAAEILADLEFLEIRLLTNNPEKLQLEQYGITLAERIPLEMPPTDENLDYLKTKRDRLGHLLGNL